MHPTVASHCGRAGESAPDMTERLNKSPEEKHKATEISLSRFGVPASSTSRGIGGAWAQSMGETGYGVR